MQNILADLDIKSICLMVSFSRDSGSCEIQPYHEAGLCIITPSAMRLADPLIFSWQYCEMRSFYFVCR